MNGFNLSFEQEKINNIITMLYGVNDANSIYLISCFVSAAFLWILFFIIKLYYDKKGKQTKIISVISYFFMFLTFSFCFYGVYLKGKYEYKVLTTKEIYHYIKPMLSEVEREEFKELLISNAEKIQHLGGINYPLLNEILNGNESEKQNKLENIKEDIRKLN